MKNTLLIGIFCLLLPVQTAYAFEKTRLIIMADMGNDIIHLHASPGQKLSLDASASSDPDGDNITFQWWVYKEAGTYPGSITITNPNKSVTQVSVPTDAAGKEIHVILEVQDENQEVGMYDYRRIVLEVS